MFKSACEKRFNYWPITVRYGFQNNKLTSLPGLYCEGFDIKEASRSIYLWAKGNPFYCDESLVWMVCDFDIDI